jgi:hypothetical protein
MLQLCIKPPYCIYILPFFIEGTGSHGSHRTETKEDSLCMDDKDLLVVMKSILHTADISNPAKRWAVSRKWSDLVVEEFFLQGDR